MQTGQRGAHRPAPGNRTGAIFHDQQKQRQAQLKAEEAQKRAAANLAPDLTSDERVAEVQAALKSGTAFWNEATGDVEVDLTGAYR